MGEAKRRKLKDPSYGKKSTMKPLLSSLKSAYGNEKGSLCCFVMLTTALANQGTKGITVLEDITDSNPEHKELLKTINRKLGGTVKFYNFDDKIPKLAKDFIYDIDFSKYVAFAWVPINKNALLWATTIEECTEFKNKNFV